VRYIFCLFGFILSLVAWFVAVAFLVCTPENIRSAERARMRFSPAISYVADYFKANGAYPSQVQFERWKENNGFSNNALFLYTRNSDSRSLPSRLLKWEHRDFGFIVEFWRGEWFEYYVGSQERFYPMGWNWLIGTTYSFCMVVVGFVIFSFSLKAFVSEERGKAKGGDA